MTREEMVEIFRHHMERGRHNVDVADTVIRCECGHRARSRLERAEHLTEMLTGETP
jgi:hypothetical protein